jgi:cobalt-zinc-cadmium efflux system membrane fusion protein
MLRASLTALLIAALAGSGDAPRTDSVTLWTARGELFMEYQVPVAGKPARFTAHLTELAHWKAVVNAKVAIRLARNGGPKHEGKVDGPARPGIFQPVVTLPEAGEYSGELEVAGPDLTETFKLEGVRVIKDGEKLPPEEEGHSDAISFLKEQQWKIPFATVVVDERTLAHAVHALGEVTHKPGLSVDVGSPVDGRIASAPPDVGQDVKAGETLVEIVPFLSADVDRPHIDQELMQANAEETKAQADFARISGLVGKGLMPQKELDAVRAQLSIAEAKVASAKQHRQAYLAAQQAQTSLTVQVQHYQVKAPIDGEVSHVHVTRDEVVTRDKKLFEIDDPSRVRVELKVFEPDLADARDSTGAVFTFLGEPKALTLEELKGRLVHVSHHIEAASRTAPVVFEIDNPGRRIPFGAFVEADILTKKSGRYLAVPAEAVMDDQGKHVVFVMTGGEEFEKREVAVGVHDRGWIAIASGLKAGDRVVTTGAYQIKLSTLSGQIPEHGHAH